LIIFIGFIRGVPVHLKDSVITQFSKLISAVLHSGDIGNEDLLNICTHMLHCIVLNVCIVYINRRLE